MDQISDLARISSPALSRTLQTLHDAALSMSGHEAMMMHARCRAIMSELEHRDLDTMIEEAIDGQG